MYDIEELEAQWKRYRRKRYARYALIAVVLLAVLLLPILYYTFQPFGEGGTDSNTSAPALVEKSEPKVGSAKKQAGVAERQIPPEASLQPEVPTMKDEPVKKRPKMMIRFSDEPAEGSSATRRQGRVELDMVTKADSSVVKEIEKRFPLSRDYDDAMYLAKYYYGKKDYKKSEYWAMQANMVDSARPESWILFGKSKAKKGHRKDALKVLQAYYDRTGNLEIKQLIDRIRRGRAF